MFENINFHPGKVMIDTPEFKTEKDTCYSSFEDLETLMIFTLRQDMFYVKYPNNYSIDVGWNPSNSDDWWAFRERIEKSPSDLSFETLLNQGEFQIVLVKDENWWSDDTISDNCRSLAELEELMIKYIEIVKSKM